MPDAETSAVLPDLQALYRSGTAAGVSDVELLHRFVASEGETAELAFRALVVRHGPMVLGVCRRILRNPHDIDDAFQATFLVLVRKADNLRVNDSLGRWLYGVSRRVAVRSRSSLARRSARETTNVEPIADPPDHDRAELMAALDEEVSRLPGHYRSAVVLCDLDGLTHEAAARELGCAVGTVASRLSRGRERLRDRLGRRGLSPVVITSPTVPAALMEGTVRSVSGGVSISIQTLIEGVLKELTMLKWKTIAVGLVVVVVLGGLGTLAAERLNDEETPPKSIAAKPKARAKTGQVPGVDVPLDAPAPVKIGDALVVEVLEALPGRPISGQRFVRSDGTISLGFYGDLYVFGLNRKEIKIKLVEHLRHYINDETLGLVELDEQNGKKSTVAPLDTNMVFVDETNPQEPHRGRVDSKLNRDETDLARRLSIHERRLDDLEKRLDQMLKALESAKREP